MTDAQAAPAVATSPRRARELTGQLARELARDIHRTAVEPIVEVRTRVQARALAIVHSRRAAWYLDLVGVAVCLTFFVLAAILA